MNLFKFTKSVINRTCTRSYTPLRKIFIDTETTGLSPKQNNIISISALENENNINKIMWHTYINPSNRQISFGAAKVLDTKFFQKTFDNSPKFIDIADDLTKFLKNAILIGHNIQFDIRFINAELLNIGKPALTNQFFCTKKLSQNIFKENKGNGLDNLCTKFEIDTQARDVLGHHSYIDVTLLSEVYPKLIEIAKTKNNYYDIITKSFYIPK